MRFRDQDESGLSRRSYLGIVGAATVSTTVMGKATAEEDYEHVVNIVEEGADNSGEEPIDDVFDEHAEDDTLIKFPEGEYLANDLSVYGLTNFGMVGDDASLIPGNNYNEDLWIAGGDTHDFRFEGFTLDTTEDGVAPEIDINATDGLVVRNIYKKGSQDDGGIALGFGTTREDGTALLENIVAPDGGESVGIYIQSTGPVTVRDCRIEGFDDNGLYASTSEAPIRVEGGRYWNNNVSQVRLGSPDSYVRGAEIGIDKDLQITDGTVNARGVRISDGPGPVTIEDCDIRMEGNQGTGGIVGAFDGGTFHVKNTDIYVGEEYTTIGSDQTDTSFGILVDNSTEGESGKRLIERTSITGGGHSHGAMLFRRDDNTIRESCIQQSGDGRDGIMFDGSSNNEVTDTTINVPDKEIFLHDSSVQKSGIDTEGTCSGTDTASASVDGGTVETHQAPDEWHSVGFDTAFDDPVAIMGPLSSEGPESCHPRVRNVGDGFDYQFEEWLYLDGEHTTERAHWLALDAGNDSLGGLPADVGTLQTDNHFNRVGFDQGFDTTPVVFTQSQTYNGPNPIVTRQRDASPDGVDVRLQEEEGEKHGGAHRDETVGYVAVEPGSGTIDGDHPFEAGFADGVDDSWHRIEFSGSYDDPLFLADIQTFDGSDTANLRYRNLTDSGVDVFVEEERSEDDETWHQGERVGYLVVEGA